MTTRRSSRLGGGGGGGGRGISSLSSPKKEKKMTTSVSSSAVDENAPNLATRRLARRTAMEKEEKNTNKDEPAASDNEIVDQEEADDDEDDDDDDAETFVFNGVTYATYQEMVDAKRLRNQQVLVASGLLEMAAAQVAASSSSANNTTASKKKRRSSSTASSISSNISKSTTINNEQDRRKSKRIAGIESDNTFIADERAGRFSIASGGDGGGTTTTTDINKTNDHGRPRLRHINDGSDLSLEQAVQLIGPKWLEDNSITQAQSLMRDVILPPQKQEASSSSSSLLLSSTNNNNINRDCSAYDIDNETKEEQAAHDTTTDDNKNQYCSWAQRQMRQQAQERSLDNDNNSSVAKVVPDRIYSIATHPSSHQLVVCVGDKQGHVGIWNVDAGASSSSSSLQATAVSTTREEETDSSCGNDSSPKTASKNNKQSNSSRHDDGIHLFRPHASTTACLEWTRQGTALLSTSYDGTCRLFDVAAERFQQVFDSSCLSNGNTGVCLHESESDYYNDSDYWFQYACLDHRNQDCFFLSTSVGTAMHVDMRASGKERITFHQEFSEKKINSLSLHPNGYSLLSAGLDTKARLWDLRLLSSSSRRSSSRKRSGVQGHQVQPVAYYNAGRSINSAFFSPSGKYVVSTTMMDRLDILQDIHTAAGTMTTTLTAGNTTAAIRVEPVQIIRHNNKTGRWLSTFRAQWHPVHDVFCVGSMQQPRVMDVYFLEDPLNNNNNNNNNSGGDHFGRVAIGGEAMTAVTSRCCFHALSDQLIVVGGTSSGRVAISR